MVIVTYNPDKIVLFLLKNKQIIKLKNTKNQTTKVSAKNCVKGPSSTVSFPLIRSKMTYALFAKSLKINVYTVGKKIQPITNNK